MDELIAEEVCAWMWKSKECKSRRCEYPLKVYKKFYRHILLILIILLFILHKK